MPQQHLLHQDTGSSHSESSRKEIGIPVLFSTPVTVTLDTSGPPLVLHPQASSPHTLSTLLWYDLVAKCPARAWLMTVERVVEYLWLLWGFPGGSDGKESACNAGDLGLITGLWKSTGEENGNLLQYSCLENSMHRGAWQATVHVVTKSQTQLTNTNKVHKEMRRKMKKKGLLESFYSFLGSLT